MNDNADTRRDQTAAEPVAGRVSHGLTRLGDGVVAASGWGLLGVVVWAPWAQGSIPPWAVHTLQAMLGAVGVVWVLGVLLRRRWPGLPVVCVAAAVLLVSQGCLMAFNAHRQYVFPEPGFTEITAIWPGLPGSWDAAMSWNAVRTATAMLGAMLVACDLGRRARWRHRLWWILCLNGAAIALFGSLEHLGLIPTPRVYAPGTAGAPFGPFDYHGDAGAMLGLILALSLALLIRSTRRIRWMGGQLIVGALLLGLFLNVARAGMLVAGAVLAVYAGGWLMHRRGATRPAASSNDTGLPRGHGAASPSRSGRRLAGLGVMVLLVALVVGFAAGPRLIGRWSRFSETFRPRLLRDKIGLAMASDAPVFGIGPGVFKAAFPVSSHFDPALYRLSVTTPYQPGERVNTWNHLTMDYLQTQIEWGVIGLILWLTLGVGGAWRVVRRWRQSLRGRGIAVPDRAMMAGLLTALGAVGLYALVDAPMQVPSIQLYVAVVLGLCWSAGGWGRG